MSYFYQECEESWYHEGNFSDAGDWHLRLETDESGDENVQEPALRKDWNLCQIEGLGNDDLGKKLLTL